MERRLCHWIFALHAFCMPVWRIWLDFFFYSGLTDRHFGFDIAESICAIYLPPSLPCFPLFYNVFMFTMFFVGFVIFVIHHTLFRNEYSAVERTVSCIMLALFIIFLHLIVCKHTHTRSRAYDNITFEKNIVYLIYLVFIYDLIPMHIFSFALYSPCNGSPFIYFCIAMCDFVSSFQSHFHPIIQLLFSMLHKYIFAVAVA